MKITVAMRMGLIMALLTAVVFIAGIVGISSIRSIHQSVENITAKAFPLASDAKSMNTFKTAARLELRKYLSEFDPNKLDEREKRYREYIAEHDRFEGEIGQGIDQMFVEKEKMEKIWQEGMATIMPEFDKEVEQAIAAHKKRINFRTRKLSVMQEHDVLRHEIAYALKKMQEKNRDHNALFHALANMQGAHFGATVSSEEYLHTIEDVTPETAAENRRKFRKEFDDFNATFEKWKAELLLTATDTGNRAMAEKISALHDDFVFSATGENRLFSLLEKETAALITEQIHITKVDELGKSDWEMANKIIGIAEENVQASIDMAEHASGRANLSSVLVSLFTVAVSLFTIVLVFRIIIKPLRELTTTMEIIGKGDLTIRLKVRRDDEFGQLAASFNKMTDNLKKMTYELEEQAWLKTHVAEISAKVQGARDLKTLAGTVITELTPLIGGAQGAFALKEETDNGPVFTLQGGYARKEQENADTRFHLGEGLAGQCARDGKPILLTDVPSNHIKISTVLGESSPLKIIAQPVLFEGETLGVVEVASFHEFTPNHLTLLGQLSVQLGIIINSIKAHMKTEVLLKESQTQTEELQTQSEELQKQSEELQETNEQLEEQTQALQKSQQEINRRNTELEEAQSEINKRAEQLEQTNKYKSEFLANMSHELRTPLNSILILSNLLQNSGELNDELIQHASVINESGSDLLQLINDILDLSKVEAGKLDICVVDVPVKNITKTLEAGIRPQTEEKGLSFNIETDESLPVTVRTDRDRIVQILNNFLSNAIKFTREGGITLRVHGELPAGPGETSFSVSDTGIGIPADKQEMIFEAFQQIDGSASREYSGTGLGLSICRSMSRMLGGRIHLESAVGRGSTFTLIVPVKPPATLLEQTEMEPGSSAPARIEGVLRPHPYEAGNIRKGDKVLLIIEDDNRFAEILEQMGRKNGYKVVIAGTGHTGISMANQIHPSSIILDIQLPVIDGWEVLRTLKRSPATRHIPVQVVTVTEEEVFCYKLGALNYVKKPVKTGDLEDIFRKFAGFELRN